MYTTYADSRQSRREGGRELVALEGSLLSPPAPAACSARRQRSETDAWDTSLHHVAHTQVLRGLTNETIEFLGLNPKWARPEWLVITVFPVAPPHVRPSVMMEGALSSDDDLTHM